MLGYIQKAQDELGDEGGIDCLGYTDDDRGSPRHALYCLSCHDFTIGFSHAVHVRCCTVARGKVSYADVKVSQAGNANGELVQLRKNNLGAHATHAGF